MLYYHTVADLLKDSLIALMRSSVFEPFRLVGGTALSLQIGHRVSVDIDLFTDMPYGSIDFKKIDEFINNTFPFHDHSSGLNPAMGKSYTVGIDKEHAEVNTGSLSRRILLKLLKSITTSSRQGPMVWDGRDDSLL